MTTSSQPGRMLILAAIDGRLEGAFAVADAVYATSKEVVKRLTSMGIQVAMLTGDNHVTAERIAEELGIKTIFADVLPGDKAMKKGKILCRPNLHPRIATKLTIVSMMHYDKW